MYELIWTPHFERQLRRFRRAHPEMKQRIARTLAGLQADPLQPHLRLHPLHGDLAGQHAVSITHSYRITLILRISEREVTLLDIGGHDEVYR